jgi:hypothetical protein
MNELESRDVQCPYCGEIIDILIDCSVSHQDYIEDCQVCCQPINLEVTVGQGDEPVIVVSSDND